ncbi:MAG: aspartate/glutamate racemase family protein [Pseudomonadota bacterium]
MAINLDTRIQGCSLNGPQLTTDKKFAQHTMRIALVHAVTVAMQPIAEAFARLWPEAETANLLDDRLSVDRAKDDELTEDMFGRIATLAQYAEGTGSDAILYTCSAFGEAIEAVAEQKSYPVLKPNEAMFEAALERGSNIGMLATFERSIPSMEAEFRELVQKQGTRATIKSVCIPDAMAALQAGDAPRHNSLLADAASELGSCDAIMLAQFSTSVALEAVAKAVDCPVLTSPDAAVHKLKNLLQP